MGINDLTLSPAFLAAIYPESLVDLNNPDSVSKKADRPPSSPPIESPQPIRFQGGNKQKISFVVSDASADFMNENEMSFLLKILAACKLVLEDISLINLAKTPASFTQISDQLHPRIIFCWGVRPAKLGLSSELPDFSVSDLNGISVVPVHSRDVLQGDSKEGVELKKRLWACLKKLFTL